jgi:hypothetical protein
MPRKRCQLPCQYLDPVQIREDVGLNKKFPRRFLQCGFASAIGADDCNARLQSDIKIDALENEFVTGVSKADLRHLEKRGRDFLRFRKSNRRLMVESKRRVERCKAHLKVSVSAASGGCKSGSWSSY